MKIVKYVVLQLLLLITMLLCSTAVMKILDLMLNLKYENIWVIGFKVGFLSWLLFIFVVAIKFKKKNI